MSHEQDHVQDHVHVHRYPPRPDQDDTLTYYRAMEAAVIVDAVRTPVGRYGGALKDVRPDDLAALVIRPLVERNALDPALVEDVILGCANGAGEDGPATIQHHSSANANAGSSFLPVSTFTAANGSPISARIDSALYISRRLSRFK